MCTPPIHSIIIEALVCWVLVIGNCDFLKVKGIISKIEKMIENDWLNMLIIKIFIVQW